MACSVAEIVPFLPAKSVASLRRGSNVLAWVCPILHYIAPQTVLNSSVWFGGKHLLWGSMQGIHATGPIVLKDLLDRAGCWHDMLLYRQDLTTKTYVQKMHPCTDKCVWDIRTNEGIHIFIYIYTHVYILVHAQVKFEVYICMYICLDMYIHDIFYVCCLTSP